MQPSLGIRLAGHIYPLYLVHGNRFGLGALDLLAQYLNFIMMFTYDSGNEGLADRHLPGSCKPAVKNIGQCTASSSGHQRFQTAALRV